MARYGLLSLTGWGGVGKTALAHKIIQDEAVNGGFDSFVVGVISLIKDILFFFNSLKSSASSSGCRSTIIKPSTPFFYIHLQIFLLQNNK